LSSRAGDGARRGGEGLGRRGGAGETSAALMPAGGGAHARSQLQLRIRVWVGKTRLLIR
jgi:hypothetical protein